MSLKLGNIDIAGTQVLYSTTGNNTDGAMTQAATTTQLNLKANDADVVHKTGPETITGLKIIKRNGDSIQLSTPNITDSSTLGYCGIACYGNDSSLQLGAIGFYKNSLNQEIVLRAYNRNNPNDNYKEALLHLVCNNNDAPYATVPASDVNGSILTTVNKSKSQNGYFKLGNGLIIQWGKTPNISNSGTVCTLPTPFTTTNYSVTAITSATFNENSIGLIGKTTTNFTLVEKGYNNRAHNVPNYFIAIGY